MRIPFIICCFLAVVNIVGCGSSRDSSPAKFNSNDVSETARWAAQLAEAVNALPSNSNKIARNDAVQAELKSVKSIAEPVVGQLVSWKMQCGVSEHVVTILPNQFGRDGRAITFHQESNPIAMMVLDDRPMVSSLGRPTRDIDPQYWSFQLDVPEQITLETAKNLPENVIVRGRIKEIEIERFRDRELDDWEQSEADEWYLLYVYLTDVTLEPDGQK